MKTILKACVIAAAVSASACETRPDVELSVGPAEELRSIVAASGESRQERADFAKYALYDTNADGVLTQTELERAEVSVEYIEARWARRRSDAVYRPVHRSRAAEPPGRLRKRPTEQDALGNLPDFDENGDGSVSADERHNGLVRNQAVAN